MKKSELKNLIKDCIKEVIFEEGVLSNIISEVATGISGQSGTTPTHQVQTSQAGVKMGDLAKQAEQTSKLMEDKRREVLNAIGNSSYTDLASKFSNPEFFEGTQPLQESSKGPLSGTPAADYGLDISNIPGFQNWGSVADKSRK